MGETLRLVTRFNEHTNDLEVVGIGTSEKAASDIIKKDFEDRGVVQFRKVAGSSFYNMEFHKGVVFVRDTTTTKGVVLSYTMTEIPPDTAIAVNQF